MTLFDEVEQSPPAAPPGPLVRVRLLVAYDGAGFSGFAAQPASTGIRTVAGVLAGAIERAWRHPVTLTCAGRTDSGVHAWGQVVHFDTPIDSPDCGDLARRLNKMLAPAIAIRAAEVAPEGFDARFSAQARSYRYTVLNTPTPSPFLAGAAWHVPDLLDLRSMTLGCDPLLGEHDFSSFCRKPAGQEDPPMTRRVTDARWLDLGDGVLRFDVEANAFCHQMVRSLVGTLVDVGRGRIRAGDLTWILRAKDRSKAAQPAPPHGLCLWKVTYPDGFGTL